MDFSVATLIEILDRILRSWWTVVAGICLGASAGLGAMHYLPKVYEAKTKIFVAPPKVPADFVRTTVVDDMALRMEALEQAVLSRPYLEKLIGSEFKPAPTTDAGIDGLIRSIRSRVKVLVANNVIDLSFSDVNPGRAAKVVNTLADIYIQENSKYRTARAGETTKAIQDVANRVRAELDTKEKQIADFKSAHLYETADRQAANLQLLSARQKDLEAKEAELADAREALRIITDMEKEAEAAPAILPRGPSASSGGTRVAMLERELESLKLRYSDEHPQVKAKQRELDEARAAMKTDVKTEKPLPTTSGQAEAMRQQRTMMENQVTEIEAGVQKLRSEIALYERRIEQTPQIELQLSELSKGYDVLLEQYKTYQTKLEAARTSQEMEESRKGEQFEVLERAFPPVMPVRPAPMRVFGVAIVFGLVGFVGPLALRVVLRPLVNSEAALRALSADIPLLVSIPRLEAPESRLRDRRRWMMNIGLSAAAVAILATAVLVLH